MHFAHLWNGTTTVWYLKYICYGNAFRKKNATQFEKVLLFNYNKIILVYYKQGNLAENSHDAWHLVDAQ